MPTAATVPPQIGSPKIVQGAPKFAAYTVVDGTWKEKDDTQMLMTRDGDSKVNNFTFWSPGIDAQCDWVIINTEGNAAATVGEVITEVVPEGQTARAFIVMPGTETSEFGGKPLKQSVKLAYYAGFTPTVNS
jgi:hypothetical protein